MLSGSTVSVASAVVVKAPTKPADSQASCAPRWTCPPGRGSSCTAPAAAAAVHPRLPDTERSGAYREAGYGGHGDRGAEEEASQRGEELEVTCQRDVRVVVQLRRGGDNAPVQVLERRRAGCTVHWVRLGLNEIRDVVSTSSWDRSRRGSPRCGRPGAARPAEKEAAEVDGAEKQDQDDRQHQRGLDQRLSDGGSSCEAC